MHLIGNLIVRLITVSVGFLLAVIAAGLFLSLGFYNEVMSAELYADPVYRDFYTLLTLIIGVSFTSVMGIYAAGTAGILIAIAELMRWKGLVSNLLLGGLCGAILTSMAIGIEFNPETLDGRNHDLNPLLVGMSAGFVAGFVYWLIAGRRAGDWMPQANHTEQERA